ncbi:Mur ligase family protein [Estrella lausannensis]|uniref:UDP-N-acetylmuramoyl-tripeptide--D-alanyl-D-alanine ligase n=1 Tax=Estrella lausannensis TaxID=483423 RepID=A0A0H5DSN7_9BACT|nr:UDP-N-acetylmuramoyl-tripeptide--D-alanyl-D-alanine ligase [Estrella lausannensis]CRX39328.1 UDP-N-acetylmuramoyl-tripeptide--D-alanyl-D-alanine ligase [Estrella lausannensis]
MISLLSLLAAFSFFIYRRMKRLLRYLQQDDYIPSRFVRWFVEKKAFDMRGSAVALCGGAISLLGWEATPWMALGYLVIGLMENNPEKSGKMPLKMTARAKRILWVASAMPALCFAMLLLLFYRFFPAWPAALLISQAVPLYLLAAVAVLSIDETRRQRRFMEEAKKRLLDVNPLVIGITGSYGKTTTKHFLSKLMQQSLGPTFFPGKGVNTPMGITREIRERLKDRTPYAVVEMAAYGKGSIHRLTKLTPPRGAILTIIGKAHLERFGSQEMIRKTKAELAEAVPEDGFLVLNGDDPLCRKIGLENPKKAVLYYGYSEDLGPLDLKMTLLKSGAAGTEVEFLWRGKPYTATVSLHGKPIIANLGSAFLTVCHLGADPAFVTALLPHLEAYDNRLQVRREGDITVLHDAYNSNPSGFKAAVDVLASVDGKRRILMTPGMIELAEEQEKENEEVAFASAKVADLALIVGETNREALKRGLLKGGMSPENILFFKGRDEAFHYLKDNRKEGDVLLIENDLLDLHEAKEAF